MIADETWKNGACSCLASELPSDNRSDVTLYDFVTSVLSFCYFCVSLRTASDGEDELSSPRSAGFTSFVTGRDGEQSASSLDSSSRKANLLLRIGALGYIAKGLWASLVH